MFEDVVPLRDGMIKRLENRAPLTAMVPAARIYGEAQPSVTDWPFVRYGAPILTPEEASGWTGARHRVTFHVFARGPSMDECAAICAQIVNELDGQDIDLVFPDGVDREATAYELFLQASQIIRDGTEDWHGIVEFNVTVAGA